MPRARTNEKGVFVIYRPHRTEESRGFAPLRTRRNARPPGELKTTTGWGPSEGSRESERLRFLSGDDTSDALRRINAEPCPSWKKNGWTLLWGYLLTPTGRTLLRFLSQIRRRHGTPSCLYLWDRYVLFLVSAVLVTDAQPLKNKTE
jgi:hypothetical protein